MILAFGTVLCLELFPKLQNPASPANPAQSRSAPRIVEPVIASFDPDQVGEGSWPGAIPPNVDSAAAHGVFIGEETLAFAGGELRTGKGLAKEVRELAAARGSVHAFIQISGPLEESIFVRLHDLGVRTWAVFPHNAIQAEIPYGALAALAALPEVRWIGVAPPLLKLHPNLRACMEQAQPGQPLQAWVSLMGDDRGPATRPLPSEAPVVDWNAGAGVPNRLAADTVPDEDASVITSGPFEHALRRAGVQVHYFRPNTRTFAITATAQQLWALAQQDAVHFLDLRGGETLFHDRTAPMLGQDDVRGVFNGASAEVGMIDGGVNLAHQDLAMYAAGKSTTALFNAGKDPFSDLWGHGTHIAGTIAGRGIADPRYKGMAPGVGSSQTERFFVGRYFDDAGVASGSVTELYSWLSHDYVDGATQTTTRPKLISCSWGTLPTASAWKGTEQECIDVDGYVWSAHQLYVFAAGDGGGTGVAKPAVAKNVLAVGSVTDRVNVIGDDTIGDISATSSMGPAGDGRLKPEITAPGQFVTSADTNNTGGYITLDGTSQAAPHILGLLAALVSHYPGTFDQFGSPLVDYSNPKFLRACALATALKKSGSQAVGDVYGFGLANAARLNGSVTGDWDVLWTPSSYVRASGPPRYGFIDWTIPEGTRRWTVVLTWDEPPTATTGGATPVMGHIDLYLDYNADQPGYNTGDLVSNGNGNYQYLVIDNPPAGTHRLKFWPRDTDYDNNGTIDSLYYSVCQVLDYGDVRPQAHLTVAAADPYIKPGEIATLTAQVGVDSHVATDTAVEVMNTPPGLTLSQSSRTLRDGTSVVYTPGKESITMGAVAAADAAAERSVDYQFTGDAEGTYMVAIRSNNDNGPDTNGHSEQLETILYVDGSPPGPVSNLSSPTHGAGAWSNSNQVDLGWNPAHEDRSGLDGYATSLTASASLPDPVKTIGDVSTDHVAPLDGRYWYNIRSVDKSGNWSPTSVSYGPIQIDTTHPLKATGFTTNPAANGTWTNDPSIDLTWTDALDGTPQGGGMPSGLDGYALEASTDPNTPPAPVKSVEDGLQAKTISPGDGTWYFKLRSVDNAGNWDDDFARNVTAIKIDTLGPPLPYGFSSDPPANNWSTDFTVNLSWQQAPDKSSGLFGYATSVSPNAPADPGYVKTHGETPLTDYFNSGGSGTFYYNIRPKDYAGNWTSSYYSYGPIQVDITKPGQVFSLGSDTHQQGVFGNNPNVHMTWVSAQDPHSGIMGYSWEATKSVNGFPDTVKDIGNVTELTFQPGEGKWNFRIAAVDNVSNWADFDREWSSLWVDSLPPLAATGFTSSTHPLTSNWYKTPTTVTLNWTKPADDTSAAPADEVSGLDGFGFSTTTAPMLPPAVRSFGTVATTTATPGDGKWFFNLRSLDKAGNWDGDFVSYGPVWIDSTKPDQVTSIGSTSHPAEQWTNTPTVTLTWSPSNDATSLVDGYSVGWDTSSSVNPDSTKEVEETSTGYAFSPGEGQWYVNVRAIDNAGNASALGAAYGRVRIDTTPPTTPGMPTSTSHSQGGWSNDNTVDLNWSASSGGPSGIAGYSVLDSMTTGGNPPHTVNSSGNSTTLAAFEGPNFFNVAASDGAGNWGNPSPTFGPILIDTVAPAKPGNVRSTTHSTGVWSKVSSISFAWDFGSDPLSGVDGYSFLYNTAQDSPDSTLEVQETVGSTTQNKTDNIYWFRVRTVDNAHNGSAYSTADSIGPFMIDTTPPGPPTGLMSSSHVINIWSGDNTVDLTWTAATDNNLSGIDGYSIGTFSSNSTLPGTTKNMEEVTAYTITVPDGQWYINLRAVDNAGNWGTNNGSFGKVWIDTLPPASLSVKADSDRSYTLDNLVDLTLSATDTGGSGLDQMRFSNDGTTWSTWQTYATSKTNWDLVSFGGNGSIRVNHTVYAQFKDKVGNLSAVASDVIYWAYPIEFSPTTISYGSPGNVTFKLYAGVAYANKNYVLLGSYSGTVPGFNLPKTGGGLINLPLNLDTFFLNIQTSLLTGSPAYVRFFGRLDAEGKTNPASPPIYTPTGTSFFHDFLQGRTLNFAYAAGTVLSGTSYNFGYTSPPVTIPVVP